MPRYSQVRYAPGSFGKMKRLAKSQTQTTSPNATRMRSPGVSNIDQIFSIWGLATQAVTTARIIRKSVRTAVPPIQIGTGMLGPDFFAVSAAEFVLMCMAQSITRCLKTYRSLRCNSKSSFRKYIGSRPCLIYAAAQARTSF
jgi:hypothetical protein